VSDMLSPPFPLPLPPSGASVLAELFPEFVQAWIHDVEAHIERFSSSRDTDNLYRLGHTIKGSFQQFGLDEHASIGIALMEYARTEAWDHAMIWLVALLEMLRSLQQSLDHSL